MKDPAFLFYPADWKTPHTYNKNYQEPTQTSGVYLLVRPIFLECKVDYDILYVGSSKNLSKRYVNHEVYRILTATYEYIQFYFKEIENYREVEKNLIKKIQPKYNKQWR